MPVAPAGRKPAAEKTNRAAGPGFGRSDFLIVPLKSFFDSGHAAQSFTEEGGVLGDIDCADFAAFAVWLNSTAKLSIAMRNRRERKTAVMEVALRCGRNAANLILKTRRLEKRRVEEKKYFWSALKSSVLRALLQRGASRRGFRRCLRQGRQSGARGAGSRRWLQAGADRGSPARDAR